MKLKGLIVTNRKTIQARGHWKFCWYLGLAVCAPPLGRSLRTFFPRNTYIVCFYGILFTAYFTSHPLSVYVCKKYRYTRAPETPLAHAVIATSPTTEYIKCALLTPPRWTPSSPSDYVLRVGHLVPFIRQISSQLIKGHVPEIKPTRLSESFTGTFFRLKICLFKQD